MSDFLSRVKRRVTLIGGPMDGRDIPIPLPGSMPLPAFNCSIEWGGEWHHYVRAADDWYQYAGLCADIDHNGAEPHDHDDCGGAQ